MGNCLRVCAPRNNPCVVLSTAFSARGRWATTTTSLRCWFLEVWASLNPRLVDNSVSFPLHLSSLHMLLLSLSRLPLEEFLKQLKKTATGGADKLQEMESHFRTTLCVAKREDFFIIMNFFFLFYIYFYKLHPKIKLISLTKEAC